MQLVTNWPNGFGKRSHNLPDREAEVFCMRYFEGLSNPQIADVLHVRTGAVAVALHKAKAKLETMLAEAPTEDESCRNRMI